jgi:putative transposase
MQPSEVDLGAIADTFYRLVVSGSLYVDLVHERLDDQRRCHVYLDAADAAVHGPALDVTTKAIAAAPVEIAVGRRLVWDGRAWEIDIVGDSSIALLGEGGGADGTAAVTELPRRRLEALIANGVVAGVGSHDDGHRLARVREAFARAGLASRKTANARYACILPVLNGSRRVTSLSRNERRWLARFKNEERASGVGYVGLFPRLRPGNTTNHKVMVTDAEIEAAIDAIFGAPHQPGRLGFMRRLSAQLFAGGVKELPSRRRMYRLLRGKKTHRQDVARLGSRAAYGSEAFLTLSLTTPPHGRRPFEIGHLDHTQLDIELVDSENPDLVLGRPWLTLLIDAFTRRVLAAWLTFDPPSYRSDMMALRLCVRRHNRLPDIIVTDRGADFESTYYETLLATLRVLKKARPASKARFGGVIERLFGLTNVLFIHELIGNTKATRRVRTLSSSVDPRGLAVWDLETFYEVLAAWFYDVYDTRLHPSLGKSPRLAHERGIELSGAREARYWAFDDDFIRLTLPSNAEGKLSIHKTAGLRFNGRRYWNDAFKEPRLWGKPVEFVWDPWDMRYLLAYVDGAWLQCWEPTLAHLRPLSERELLLVSAEWTARQKAIGASTRRTDVDLGTFLLETDAHGEILAQRRKDAAARRVAAAAGVLGVALDGSGVEITTTTAERQQRLPAIGLDPRSVPVIRLEEYE